MLLLALPVSAAEKFKALIVDDQKNHEVWPEAMRLKFEAYMKECGAGSTVTLHMFEKGGHRYGLKGKGLFEGWPDLLDGWLAKRFE